MTNYDLKYSFIIIYRSIILIMIFFLLKALLVAIITGNTAIKENDKPIAHSLEYRIVSVKRQEYDFGKPEFDKEYLNNFVDDYIEKNACTTLEYNIKDLGESRINVFLNCGTPTSIAYDYDKEKVLKFSYLTKNYRTFLEKTKQLLALKYPKFVVAATDFDRGAYAIKDNQINAYYPNEEFGPVTIAINNNEIKDLMKYEMSYDDAYENEVYTLNPSKKMMAFTFDDGPSSNEIDLVNTLKDAHATATFYLVGNRLQNFQKSVNYIIDNGMDVGNHTYDHKSLVGLSDEQVAEEITKTDEIFYDITGQKFNTLRPSYGAVNSRIQKSLGLPIVLWDIDTLDWKYRNSEKVSATILNEAHDGAIVLMHSIYTSTKDAVKDVLPKLYKEGYQIVSVTEFAKLRGIKLKSGETISNFKETK